MHIKDSKVLKCLKNKYFIVSVSFLVWIFFFDTTSVLRCYSTMKDIATQQRQIEYYKNEIKNTDEQLKELSSNKDSLEKFAREQYFFHEPDEDVFIVEK